MDIVKTLNCCFLCVMVCCFPGLTVAQYFPGLYGRGAFLGGMSGVIYPEYPRSGIYPDADLYTSRAIYPGTDMYDPILDPRRTVVGGGLLHRPAVVSDRSDRTTEHINISNNNENIRSQVDSGNVVVNQVTSSNTGCNCQVHGFDQCPYPQQCVREGSCTGGSGICRNIAFPMI